MNNNIKNKLWFCDIEDFFKSIDTNFKYLPNIKDKVLLPTIYKNNNDVRLLIIYLLKKILDIIKVNYNKRIVLVKVIKYFFTKIGSLYHGSYLFENTKINNNDINECVSVQRVLKHLILIIKMIKELYKNLMGTMMNYVINLLVKKKKWQMEGERTFNII